MKLKCIYILAIIFLCTNTTVLSAGELKPLLLREVKAEGWIKSQITRDWTSGSFSVMWNNSFLPLTLGSIKSGSSNVRNKFRDGDGHVVYTWDYSEMEGNMADAAVRAMFLADNAALKSRYKVIMDFMVDSIAATQYADSVAYYAYNGGELFNQTCMERAMLAYYEYTGEDKYYDAVKILVDKTIILWGNYLDEGKTYFGRPFEKKGAMNHSLAFSDILEYLYRRTGNRKYVDFAFKLYKDFSANVDRIGAGDDGGADASLDQLMNTSVPFYGHAPHTLEHLRMPLWLSLFVKDSTQVMKNNYALIISQIPVKLYQSLSPSKGLITDLSKFESVNGRFSSGNLPYEYCSLLEGLNTFNSLSRKLGEARYGDDAEILFFNAAQGARFPDGKANTYLVCDNVEKATTERNWRDQYSALHGIRCCNLNAARIAPNYVANMWMKNQEETELIAMLHGPSVVETKMNGVNVRIVAESNYPFEENLRFSVTAEAPVDFTLVLRNPSWSTNSRLIADEGALVSFENGYYKIHKLWGTSEQLVTLKLDEQIQIKKLNNADSKDFYVQRGPLLYTYPYTNEKTSTQVRAGFPSYFSWDIWVPSTLTDDYNGMQMLTTSPDFFANDSSFLRYKSSTPFIPEFPFDYPAGKITGRFALNGALLERELVPMGCATTRRTTFTPTSQLSKVSPVMINISGNKTAELGVPAQYSAVVKSQFNTTISNPALTWSVSSGSVTQTGIFTPYKSTGEAVISVSCGSITSEYKVIVNNPTSTNFPDAVKQIAYPTVTDGEIRLSEKQHDIRIYYPDGRLAYSDNSYTDLINISHLSEGCYILHVDGMTVKIIKK